MKTIAAVILFLIAGIAYGQTARVIPLSPEDAQTVKAKWDALQAAQKAWNEEQDQIAKKYTYVKRDDPDASGSMTPMAFSLTTGAFRVTTTAYGLVTVVDPCKNPKTPGDRQACADQKKAEAAERYFRKGFEEGFEFDKEFKYIVPKTTTQNCNQSGWWITASGSSSQPCPATWQSFK